MCYTALRTGHQSKSKLLGSPVGVFVGIQVGEFSVIRQNEIPGPYTATGGSAAIASNRVSYVLGLEGPSMSVDTACSSALVGLEGACYALRAGSCVSAVVLRI